LNPYQKAFTLLTPHEKRQAVLVLVLVVFMALLETAGVASILPFMAVLGNPSVVETQPVLSALYTMLNFESVDRFLMALGIAVFGVIILSAGFRIFTTYVMNRFIMMRRHTLAERLLETYLRQPYAFFLDRHNSDLVKSILSEADQVVVSVFQPGFRVIAYSVVTLALVALLFIINPWLALGAGAIIGGMYTLIFLVVRGLLDRIGRDRIAANRERFVTAGEALGGIKDIKLLGREYAYLSRFQPASIRFGRHHATTATLAEIPKYLIEAMGIGAILLLTLVLMATTDGVGAVLPILGVYVFAGYKLIPAAQKIYEGVARLQFGMPAVEELCADLRHRSTLSEIHHPTRQTLNPLRDIRLDGLSFTYSNAAKPALHDINLTIPVGGAVGLVGGTGAGKTTLVDIILGLLRPTEGAILVDGVPVTGANLRNWQNALGYVPQGIFLTDTSVMENIALGTQPDDIDREAVARCARLAQAHDFIMHELPRQYETLVGERGVRLSGGQRQRIGIARALYHNPSVLVFDEATSALDTLTERAVMEAVNALSQQKTIILVTHRLSTVRACDRIFLLEEGRLVGQGGYDELVRHNERFRTMASSYSLSR
jgi:ABC-type multidrug transport system fused ATPase/permease subunit